MSFVKKNIIFMIFFIPYNLFSTFNPTIPTYNNHKTINLAALIQDIVLAIIPIPVSVNHGGTGNATLTSHGVLIGEGILPVAAVASVSPSGIPLVSQGAGVDPAYSTAVVAGGGTGLVTATTAYVLLASGTTPTGSFQPLANAGTANQVLISQGASALPVWSDLVPMVISRTLTNAELKALATTPVTIINAPGAGKIVDVLKCMVRLTYGGSNVFTTASGTIQLRYNTSNISIIAAIASNALIVGSVNQVLGTINGGQDLANYLTGSFVSNQAVEVFNPGAAIVGNAANDNTITVVITYQIITI